MNAIRQKMLPVYSETVFEVRYHETWYPVPPATCYRAIITAWNPDGQLIDAEDNLVRDIMLKDDLSTAKGLKVTRARGRHKTWVEEGWLIVPTHRAFVLSLVRKYNQWAALVLNGRQRSLLWHDGVESLL